MEEINNITQKIIRAFYNVYNELGFGFLEKVYENAMVLELQKQGLHGIRQYPIEVFYKNINVGKYFADIFVEQCIIVELKASASLCSEHEAQILNYLKATHIEYGLLMNFGEKPEFRRKIWTNTYPGKSV